MQSTQFASQSERYEESERKQKSGVDDGDETSKKIGSSMEQHFSDDDEDKEHEGHGHADGGVGSFRSVESDEDEEVDVQENPSGPGKEKEGGDGADARGTITTQNGRRHGVLEGTVRDVAGLIKKMQANHAKNVAEDLGTQETKTGGVEGPGKQKMEGGEDVGGQHGIEMRHVVRKKTVTLDGDGSTQEKTGTIRSSDVHGQVKLEMTPALLFQLWTEAIVLRDITLDGDSELREKVEMCEAVVEAVHPAFVTLATSVMSPRDDRDTKEQIDTWSQRVAMLCRDVGCCPTAHSQWSGKSLIKKLVLEKPFDDNETDDEDGSFLARLSPRKKSKPVERTTIYQTLKEEEEMLLSQRPGGKKKVLVNEPG
eukprot:g5054.t1